jgi:hypothetical protein
MKDRDSRFDHESEGACSQLTVQSTGRLGLHRFETSASQCRQHVAGSLSLELGKESPQYRLRLNILVVAQENRSDSERVTLLDPDVILDDDRHGTILVVSPS